MFANEKVLKINQN